MSELADVMGNAPHCLLYNRVATVQVESVQEARVLQVIESVARNKDENDLEKWKRTPKQLLIIDLR